MYIQLKSFFKNKFVKIYIVVFVTVFITLTLLYNFFEYYSNFKTKTYQLNTYFLLISDDDIFYKINKIDNVVNIEKVILFEENEEEKIFSNYDFSWYNLTDSCNQFLIGKIDNESTNLVSGEIILNISKKMLEIFPDIYNLSGKNISLKTLNGISNFQVKDIKESNFSRIILSYHDYEKIIDSEKYSYLFDLDNYDETDKFYSDASKIESVNEINYVEVYDGEKIFNTIEEMKNIINILKYGCIIYFLIFLILFVIFIKEIINKENNNIELERTLGYSTIQIKKYLCIKMIILNIMIVIISVIIYLILISFILKIVPISVNFLEILFFALICIIVSCFLCLTKYISYNKIL